MRAAPAVSCANLCEECAHEHTGSAETLRHSPRNGFTAYAVISSATNSSCHRHRRIEGFVEPGWVRQNLRRFDTSNGCRDHTVLPYAIPPSPKAPARQARRNFQHRRRTTSFVLRGGRSLTDLYDPPCDPAPRRRCRVHRIPPQRCDDGQRPLVRDETAAVIVLICPTL